MEALYRYLILEETVHDISHHFGRSRVGRDRATSDQAGCDEAQCGDICSYDLS
jgi:hypothetical protein